MGSNIDISATFKYNNAGAKSALADIAALKAALAGLKGAGGGGSSSPTNIPPIPTQTRNSVLAFAQAQAAAQKATGDTAGAVRTMQTAVAALTPGTVAANRAIVGLANAEKALATEQNSVAASLAKTERATISEAQAMARLQAAQGNAAGAMATLSTAIDKVGASSTATLGAQTQLANLGGKSAGMFSELGSTALKAAAGLATIALALGGLNSLAGALSIVGDYEQEMNILQATSGASAQQMAALGAEAKALGADMSLPATSAASAAHAMTELVKSGLSVDNALAAAKGTLQLAAAGMIQEGEAAQDTAAALNTFRLAGSEATTVANLFAAATSKGVRVQDMAEAVKNAGTSFATYQTSAVGAKGALIELATATALLTQAGLKGAEAGTSLKVMLTFLAAPTRTGRDELTKLGQAIGQTGNIAYDSAGRMKALPTILNDVARATANMTEAQRNQTLKNIFGTDGIRAASILLQSMTKAQGAAANGWDAMTAAVQRANAAQDLAEARMKGLNGAVEGLQSQVETLALNALEPLLPIMTSVVNAMAVFVGHVGEGAGPAMTSLIADVSQLATTIQSLVIPALAAATTATLLYAGANSGALIAAIAKTTTALITNAGTWLASNAAMLAGAGMVALAAAAVGEAAREYQGYNQQIKEGAKGVLDSLPWYQKSTTALKNYSDAHLEGDKTAKAAASTVDAIRAKLQGEVEELAKAKNNFDQMGWRAEANKKHIADLTADIDRQKTALGQATTFLDKYTEGQLRSANAAAAAAQPTQLLAQARHEVPIEIVPQLDEKARDKVLKEVDKLEQDMSKAVNDAVGTATSFTEKIADTEAKHNDTILKLQQERNKAQTDTEQHGIDDRIAAEQAGYSAEIGAQAAAYAQERAAQRAHIGEMLIEWVQAQAQLDPSKFTPQVSSKLIGDIKSAYQVLDDKGAEAVANAEQGILDIANTGKGSVADVAKATDAMVAKQATIAAAFDKAFQPRAAEVEVKMKGKPLEDISAELDAVRRVTYAEVQITQKGDPHDIAEAILSIPPERQSAIAVTLNKEDPRTIAAVLAELPPSVATTLAMTLVGQDPVALKNQIESIPPEHRTKALLDWANKDPQRLAAEIMAMPDSHLTTAIVQMGGVSIASILSQLNGIPKQVVSTIITRHVDQYTGGSPNEGNVGRASGGPVAAGQTYTVGERGPETFVPMTNGYIVPNTISAAGGGSFVTQGPTTIVAGDNPGGAELVTVTPLSGKGTTTTSGNTLRMAGGGTAVVSSASESTGPTTSDAVNMVAGANQIIASILPYIAVPKGTFRAIELYMKELSFVAEMLSAASSIRSIASTAIFPIRPETVKALGTDTNIILSVLIDTINPQLIRMANATKKYGEFVKAATEILTEVVDTRRAIATPQPPIDPKLITTLAQEAVLITTTIQANLLPTQQRQADALTRYTDAVKTSIDVITGVADLRDKLASPHPPIDLAYVKALADESLKVGAAIGGVMVPIAQEDVDKVKAYADAVTTSLSVLSGVQDLRDKLTKPQAPINLDYVKTLAAESLQVGGVMGTVMVPIADQALTTLKSYGDAVGGAIGVLTNVQDLREKLGAPQPAISMDYVAQLADNAEQATGIISQRVLPFSQSEIDGLKRYQDAVGSSVDVLSGIQSLAEKATKPQPPINADYVAMLADAAEQTAGIISQRILPLSQGDVENLKLYQDAVGGSVSILTGTQDLAEKTATIQPPINPDYIASLADAAEQTAGIISQRILPFSQDQVDALKRYQDSVGAAVAVLSNIQDLAEKATKPQPALDMSYVQTLADQSVQVATILTQVVVPYSQEQTDALKLYADAVGSSITTLSNVQDLAEKTSTPQPAIDPTYIAALADQSVDVASILSQTVLPFTQEQNDALKTYADVVGSSISVLNGVQELAKGTITQQPIIDPVYIASLADQSVDVASILSQTVLPFSEDQQTALKTYAEIVGSSISVLNGIQELAKNTLTQQPIIDPVYIASLADQSVDVASILTQTVIPFTEDEQAALKTYADVIGSSISVLNGVQSLAKETTTQQPAIDPAYIQTLADESQQVATIVEQSLIPYTDDEAAALKTYADTVGSAVSILNGVISLNNAGKDLAPLISDSQIAELAQQANHITDVVLNNLLPVTEDEAAAVKTYAETAGAAVSALKDALSLSGKLFADYISPTDAQLALIANDTNRVIASITQAASAYSTDGLTAAKAYADATNSTFQAYKEGLLFFQALNSGDFNLDDAKLQLFEASMAKTISVADRLSAQAATIPASNLNALQAVTAALTAEYESLIKLAAVPADSLAQAQAMVDSVASAGGSSAAATTQYITNYTTNNQYVTNNTYTTQNVMMEPGAIVVEGAGQNASQVADAVIQKLQNRVASRR